MSGRDWGAFERIEEAAADANAAEETTVEVSLPDLLGVIAIINGEFGTG